MMEKNFDDQTVNNDMRTYENIGMITQLESLMSNQKQYNRLIYKQT